MERKFQRINPVCEDGLSKANLSKLIISIQLIYASFQKNSVIDRRRKTATTFIVFNVLIVFLGQFISISVKSALMGFFDISEFKIPFSSQHLMQHFYYTFALMSKKSEKVKLKKFMSLNAADIPRDLQGNVLLLCDERVIIKFPKNNIYHIAM